MGFFDRAFRQPYTHSTSHEYVVRLVTSWILPPSLLFAYRLLISLYAFVVLFFTLGWDDSHDEKDAAKQSFSYFTVLTYWGLAFYFAFAAAHTASYAFRRRAWLQSWPGPLKWLHSVFYATVTVFPFIVTGVFWAVLAKNAFATKYSTWSNISQHAMNSVFAFLEIILVRSDPHPGLNLIMLVIILACYLGLAYLSYDTWGFYVYSFLDPAIGRGKVAGACIGILAAAIVVFGLVCALIWLRKWLTETKLGMTGKFSRLSSSVTFVSDVEAVEAAEPKYNGRS